MNSSGLSEVPSFTCAMCGFHNAVGAIHNTDRRNDKGIGGINTTFGAIYKDVGAIHKSVGNVHNIVGAIYKGVGGFHNHIGALHMPLAENFKRAFLFEYLLRSKALRQKKSGRRLKPSAFAFLLLPFALNYIPAPWHFLNFLPEPQ